MDRLAELRERRALTLRELAEMSGVAADTINQIELGHRKPRPSTLRKLAKALGVEIRELFEEPTLSGKVEAPGRGFNLEEVLRTNHIPEDLSIADLEDLRADLAREMRKPSNERRGHPITLYFGAGIEIAHRRGEAADEEADFKKVRELIGANS
ncbi:MAG: helix-turn-helix transcriptional regulator [Actinomycetota bacterium]|nr:helix-turn-helix transcriptional regulator [Actinomycetota bacterium]